MSRPDKSRGDLPVDVLMERAQFWISRGWDVYFKWTCPNCGLRQAFGVPNVLFKRGRCERCGHVTKILYGGFMTVRQLGEEPEGRWRSAAGVE